MNDFETKVRQIVLHSLIPIACATAIAFAFYQMDVFNPHRTASWYFWSSIIAALFYYTLVYAKKRDAFAVLAILFFTSLVLTRSTAPVYVLRTVLDVGGIAAAVYLYDHLVRLKRIPSHANFGLVLSGINGACTMIAWSLQFIVVRDVIGKYPWINFLSFVQNAALHGILLGLGVGIGIVLNQKLLDRQKTTGVVA